MTILLIIISIILFLFIIWRFLFFFRNPRRIRNASKNAILSPADGYVLYIKYVNNSEKELFSIKNEKRIYLKELMLLRKTDVQFLSGWLIGIMMTPLDVHFNRAPIAGYIEKIGHEFPSSIKKNFNMFPALQNLFFKKTKPYEDCSYLVHNERASYMISNANLKIFVTQIADQYVKKIVTYKNNTFVSRGEVFGLIRMGSQVDIFIPDTTCSINIVAKERNHIKAGKDVIALVEEKKL